VPGRFIPRFLDLHLHDFLVRVHYLVSNLQTEFESERGLLRGQHGRMQLLVFPVMNFCTASEALLFKDSSLSMLPVNIFWNSPD
jgi:hypothetical protein